MPAVILRSFSCALCAASVLLAGCNGIQQSDEAAEPVEVAALKVQPESLPLALEIVGRTEGSKEVELRARVDGILEKQLYSEGSRVKAGTVLFRIDPVPYRIALERAQAELARQKAAQQQARRNADRLRTLVAQKLVSQREADDAISAVEAADAAVLAAQAEVRDAQVDLSYTRVVAPISGITGRAEHSEGSLVMEGEDSSLLTRITQTDPIWMRFALSVDEYEALRAAGARDAAALKVELLAGDGSAGTTQGRVNFAGSTVDPTLGTVQLRAEFNNPDLSILPGQYLRVGVSGGEVAAITVPQTAVLQGARGPFVWVVNDRNEAEQRAVQTGAWIGDDWRIRAGLAAGDTVILDNLLKLRPGQPVTVQWVSAPPTTKRDDRELSQRPSADAPQPRARGG